MVRPKDEQLQAVGASLECSHNLGRYLHGREALSARLAVVTVSQRRQVQLRRRRVERLHRRPWVGTVPVPIDHTVPDGLRFDLAYGEAGVDQAGPTLVLLPGGPGLASVLPYLRVRRRLAASGLHVVTPEHRGVGLSRHTRDGALLPVAAVTIEQAAGDVLAVVDAVAGDRVILAGTSYGGYLALEVARRAPDRFEALVLDSTAATVHRPERDRQRSMFWDGTEPVFAPTARRVRALAEAGALSDEELATAVPFIYELAGAQALGRVLGRAERGHTTALKRLCRLAAEETSGRPSRRPGDSARWSATLQRPRLGGCVEK